MARKSVKISVSLDPKALAVLRKYAKRKHDGNISASIQEAIDHLRIKLGQDELLEWLGDAADMTPEQAQEIDREMLYGTPPERIREWRAERKRKSRDDKKRRVA